MKRNVIACLLLLALLLGARAVAASENLLTNPDIEDVDGDGQPGGWSRDMWYFDGSSEMSVVSGAYSGSYCLYVDNLSENDARFEQTVEVQPNTLYCIRCMVRAEDCEDTAAGAALTVKDTFISSNKVYDTDGEWVPLTLYGMTGSDQTRLTVMARVGGYGSLNTGRAWFDAFEMTRLDEAPEGAFVQSLATLPPVAPDAGAQEEETGGFTLSGSAVSLIIGLAYALICLGFLLAALRSKLPTEADAGECRRVFWTLCAVALAIRAVIAVATRGYGVDMNCFEGWAARMAEVGPLRFYTDEVFCDYPPGYMYVLWLAGSLIRWMGISVDGQLSWLIIKMVPMLMDMVCAWLVYRAARESLGDWLAVLLGVLFAFNPASALNSAAWGQVDGVLTALLLISLLAASRGQWLAALPVYAVAVLVKPQALMFAPLGLVMLVVEVIESKEKGRVLLRLLGAVLLALGAWVALSLPFLWELPAGMLPDVSLEFSAFGYRVKVLLAQWLKPLAWLLGKYGGTLSSYNYITINACNLYQLLGMNWTGMDVAPATALFSWLMMGVSYAYALFLYIKGKDRGKIFLAAAVLLMLVYAFGPKMHERYLYPALALLLLAYCFDRDVRLLIAFGVLSFTQFVNVALVLQNEHLVAEQGTLNGVISLINVLSAAYLGWTGWEMCVADHTISITRVYRPAVVKAREKEKATSAVSESLTRVRDARLNLKRKDWTFMLLLTALYAVVAFPNLGSLQAPQTQWKSTASGEQITFDLGQIDDFTLAYYGGICSSTFMVQLSEDGQVWSEAHYAYYDSQQMFHWMWYEPREKDDDGTFYLIGDGDTVQRARYVRLTSERAGLVLGEVAFLDENGQTLPIASVYCVGGAQERVNDPKALIDEQDTVPPVPSYLNGMYFDEIYHGRTAYEHLNGEHAYEYSHPPLGKVLIMVGIRLFGMTPFGWRFMPALFGVMMVPLMYLMVKQLFRRSSLAFVGAFLLASDCMHFTQSRLATIDVFAVFFIMLMFLFMFRYALMNFYHVKLSRTLVPLGLSGVSMGLAIACKWIGIYGGIGLAFIFFFTLAQRFREYRFAKRNLRTLDQDSRRVAQRAIRQFGRNTTVTLCFCLVFFVLVPALIYYFSYYWHLTPDGNFTLGGVWEMQKSMYSYHKSIGRYAHDFASPWYEWPLIVRPIWYYSGANYVPSNLVSSISCMGNPVVWWGGLLALIWVIARLFSASRGDRRYLFIVVGFLAQYVPWILVSRCTFIYHYFACVPFIILATVAVFEWVRKKSQRAYRISASVYCAGASFLFIAFYPLMSGLTVLRSYAMCLRWFGWYNF